MLTLQTGPMILNPHRLRSGRKRDTNAPCKLSHGARTAAAVLLGIPSDVKIAGHGYRGEDRKGHSHGRKSTGEEHDEMSADADLGMLRFGQLLVIGIV